MRRLLPVALLTLLPAQAAAAIRIGNGGDVLDSFLQRTRMVLSQTMASLDLHEREAEEACALVARLTPAQRGECAAFLAPLAKDFLAQNTFPAITELVLESEPLEMANPDGSLRRVAAATECGADSPIRFHADSIASLNPRQLASLMVHEFGHKVVQEGRCVQDNAPTATFPSAMGGRQFLDAVAEAAVGYAVKRGFLSDEFAITDFFLCEVVNPGNPFGFESQLSVPRRYFAHGNFDHYETGPGALLRDVSCGINDYSSGQRVFLRVRIEEFSGCRVPGSSRTEVMLVSSPLEGGVGEEKILSRRVVSENITCSPGTGELTQEARLGDDLNFVFRIRYQGLYTTLVSRRRR